MTKRFFLLLLAAVLAISATTAQQFCRTADRKNFTSTKDLAPGAKLKWRFKTGDQVVSSPVLAENMLLVGSSDQHLYALDAQNGREVWKFKTGGAVKSTPAIDQGKTFFLSGDGILYALDLRTGKKAWTFATGGEKTFDTWDYYQSSPAVHDGTVYIGCGDGYVYALDAANGRLKWKFKTGNVVHAAPAVGVDALFIGSFDGFFYCLNFDGTLRWKFDTMGEINFPTGEVQFHAVVSDSTVYFCSRDYNVYALNVRTAKGHWVYHEVGSWTSVPSLGGKRLLVTTSDGSKILCIGKTYGYKVFETPLALNVFGSAAVNDSLAYIGCMDGKLHRMNIFSGKIETVFQTEWSKAHYADLFDPNTGKLRTDLEARYNNDFIKVYEAFLTLGSILSTPWIENGVVYFSSVDGYVYALE